MQLFIQFCVAFSDFIDGINGTHVHDFTFFEVNNHFIGVVHHVKFFSKYRC